MLYVFIALPAFLSWLSNMQCVLDSHVHAQCNGFGLLSFLSADLTNRISFGVNVQPTQSANVTKFVVHADRGAWYGNVICY